MSVISDDVISGSHCIFMLESLFHANLGSSRVTESGETVYVSTSLHVLAFAERLHLTLSLGQTKDSRGCRSVVGTFSSDCGL